MNLMNTTYASRRSAKKSDAHILSEGFLPYKAEPNRQYVFRLRDMPADEKPREKMLKHGSESLSLPELLSVLIGHGSAKEDVLEISSRLVKDYGEQHLAARKTVPELMKDLDLPELAAMRIAACSEIGRRLFEKREHASAVIRTPQDVYDYLAEMRTLSKEHLRGIYLNSQHRVIHDEVISIGTVDTNLIHPREVFRPAVEYGAAAVIVAHNHPSGSPVPSQADIEITKQLVSAGALIGIPLIDHVIVAKDGFASVDVEYGA